MLHGSLTIITRIHPDRLQALHSALAPIGANPDGFFEGLPGPPYGIHYARWSVLDRAPDPPGEPDDLYLVFAVDFDAGDEDAEPIRGFIDRLVDALRERAPLFDAIYRNCVGYPAAGLERPDAVKTYLEQHTRHAPAARHIDFAYRSARVEDILAACRLRDELAARLDAACLRPPDVPSGESGRREMDTWTEARQDIAAAHPELFAGRGRDRREALNAAARAALLHALVAPFCLAVLLVLGLLRRLMARTRRLMPSPTRDEAERHGVRLAGVDGPHDEQGPVENPMTHVATVRGGRLRVWMLKRVLSFINLRMQRYLFGLNHIKTIHFARWVLFETDRSEHRLLFLSNYDGSWEDYIGSFVDNRDVGAFLSFVWGNTRGFRNDSVDAFKRWLEERQFATPVWYSAYRKHGHLSVIDVHDALTAWRMLEGRTAPEEIQQLVLTGLCPLPPRTPGARVVLQTVTRDVARFAAGLVRRPGMHAPTHGKGGGDGSDHIDTAQALAPADEARRPHSASPKPG